MHLYLNEKWQWYKVKAGIDGEEYTSDEATMYTCCVILWLLNRFSFLLGGRHGPRWKSPCWSCCRLYAGTLWVYVCMCNSFLISILPSLARQNGARGLGARAPMTMRPSGVVIQGLIVFTVCFFAARIWSTAKRNLRWRPQSHSWFLY